MAWKPGKGGHFDLNAKSIDFFKEAIEDVWNAWDDDTDKLIEEGNAVKFLQHVEATASGWRREKDKFGVKVYKDIMVDDDLKYRVTVVCNGRGELKLDVRVWYSED